MDLLKNLDNMITAENFINQWITKPLDNNDVENLMIEFAKLHVEAALKQASEKAEWNDYNLASIEIDKDSILDAYSLDNIK